MKIYTRTGDSGHTGLFGGGRVPKNHIRVQAYGSVDELNATLGMAVSVMLDADMKDKLIQVQQDLFSLGASLATPGAEDGSAAPSIPPLPLSRIEQMEGWIDAATEETPELKSFILPGGSQGAAALHMARTQCRRAEREAVRLDEAEAVAPGLIPYLNRLSDLLFAFARLENLRAGESDVLWQKTSE
jgi:cob(I)alamin adenosyltransferase